MGHKTPLSIQRGDDSSQLIVAHPNAALVAMLMLIAVIGGYGFSKISELNWLLAMIGIVDNAGLLQVGQTLTMLGIWLLASSVTLSQLHCRSVFKLVLYSALASTLLLSSAILLSLLQRLMSLQLDAPLEQFYPIPDLRNINYAGMQIVAKVLLAIDMVLFIPLLGLTLLLRHGGQRFWPVKAMVLPLSPTSRLMHCSAGMLLALAYVSYLALQPVDETWLPQTPTVIQGSLSVIELDRGRLYANLEDYSRTLPVIIPLQVARQSVLREVIPCFAEDSVELSDDQCRVFTFSNLKVWLGTRYDEDGFDPQFIVIRIDSVPGD